MSETANLGTQQASNGVRQKGKPGRKPGTQMKGPRAAAGTTGATGLGAPVSSSAVGRNSPVIVAQFQVLPAKSPWSVEEACTWLQITAMGLKQAYGLPGTFVITPAKIAA